MKIYKRCALLISALAVIFSAFILPEKVCFANGENGVFYCGDSSKNCNIVSAGNFPLLTKLTLTDVCGESAEYKSFDLQAFLQSVNGEILFLEELCDSVNYYCKADLPYSVELYGHTVNLHISIKDNGVKVASPIIFGGY